MQLSPKGNLETKINSLTFHERTPVIMNYQGVHAVLLKQCCYATAQLGLLMASHLDHYL